MTSRFLIRPITADLQRLAQRLMASKKKKASKKQSAADKKRRTEQLRARRAEDYAADHLSETKGRERMPTMNERGSRDRKALERLRKLNQRDW